MQDLREYTPLTIAAATFGLKTLRVLLGFGADYNIRTFRNSSALFEACRRGNLEVVKILFEYEGVKNGNSAPLETRIINDFGFSAFETALMTDNENILRWVVEREDVLGEHIVDGFDYREQPGRLLHLCIDNGAEECLHQLIYLYRER